MTAAGVNKSASLHPCEIENGFFRALLNRPKKKKHVWKIEKEVTLSAYTHFGSCPQEMTTMYNIASYCRCLRCNETNIFPRTGLFPAEE